MNTKKNNTPSKSETTTAPVTATTTTTIVREPAAVDATTAALFAYRPRYSIIAPKDCLQITLDVQAVATSIVGPAQKIAAFRDQLAKLPDCDVESICDLENVGLALLEANQRAFGAEGNRRLDLLLQHAHPLRQKFFATFDMLVTFGVVSQAWIDSIKAGTGYKDMAGDLLSLKNKFGELPAEIRAKTMITEADCMDAASDAASIIEIVGQREANWTGLEPNPALEREQMYTLALHIYDEARRAIQYLRYFQKDADEIAPSLFVRAPRRTVGSETRSDDAPSKPVEKVAPVVPVVLDEKPSPIPPAKNGGPFTS